MAFTVDEDKNVSSNSNRDPSLRAGLTRQEGMMLVDTVINGVLSDVGNSEVNDLIQAQDKVCVISAGDLDYVPTPKDRVVISSVVYQIVQINTEEQNNTPIAFTLFLRS